MSARTVFGLAAAAMLWSGLASAELVTEEQKKFLVESSESNDAWLHDRCAFRGLVDPSVHNASIAGQVLELVANGKSPLVKEFRCAEKPPFLKTAFTPAPPEAVSCTEPKDPKKEVVCTPPLHPPPPPPPPPPSTPPGMPVVEVAAPVPPPVAPAPVAKKTKKKKKKT